MGRERDAPASAAAQQKRACCGREKKVVAEGGRSMMQYLIRCVHAGCAVPDHLHHTTNTRRYTKQNVARAGIFGGGDRR
jgi:hypothetical protein